MSARDDYPMQPGDRNRRVAERWAAQCDEIDRLRKELTRARNLLGNATGAIVDTGDLPGDMLPHEAIYKLTEQRDIARAALQGDNTP